ncbi:MAG: hypothetical protein ACKOTB_16010, partial [Planctomycetia bacterium]
AAHPDDAADLVVRGKEAAQAGDENGVDAVGDLFGTGRAALVVGNFWSTTDIPIRETVSIWTAP